MGAWSETDWNWHMREALRSQGYHAFHIRETDEPGKADLIVYHPTLQEGFGSPMVIDAWIELKKDNHIADIRPGQRQFMREHWEMSHNAIYVMFDRKVGMLAARQGDLKGRVKMLPPYPYATKWQEVFQAFKSRR